MYTLTLKRNRTEIIEKFMISCTKIKKYIYTIYRLTLRSKDGNSISYHDTSSIHFFTILVKMSDLFILLKDIYIYIYIGKGYIK